MTRRDRVAVCVGGKVAGGITKSLGPPSTGLGSRKLWCRHGKGDEEERP